MMISRNHILNFLLAIAFGLLSLNGQSQGFVKVLDLSGSWKFSIGDNPEWMMSDYDDSHWEKIKVPQSWEEQGFHGFDGYAWYRTTITIPGNQSNFNYYLELGYIDDVDAVFIDGKKIGQTGQFPPHYTTAYNAKRVYALPHKAIYFDKKITIAVRVYDEGGEGGFIHGNVALLIDKSSIFPDKDLQGDWKFKTGICDGLPPASEYESWNEIFVPGTWEDQGYKHYDGLACYATEFEVNEEEAGQSMVLLLGRIDDLDQVYLNGTLIGQSGKFNEETVNLRSDTYKQLRAYYIPDGILQSAEKNVLIVKVYDKSGLGGIWEGPVGLISQENYIHYWRIRSGSLR